MEVPEPVVDNAESREYFAQIQGALAKLDEAMGRILAAIDSEGLEKDTLVVFTTDHGLDASPYLRFKHSLHDRGIEVAYLMRLPGTIPPGSSSQTMLSNVDSLPSVLELANLTVPDALDGRSFAGVLNGAPEHRDTVFAELTNEVQNAHLRCARSGRYKLILNFAARQSQSAPIDMSKPPRGPIAPSAELYDLETDPYEMENLAESPNHRETLQRMTDSLRGWLRETGDPILKGPVPTPYYEKTRQLL